MLIDSQKAIFLHLPKTGGSSIEVWFTDDQSVGRHDQPDALALAPHTAMFPVGRHGTYDEYERYLKSIGRDIDDYFVFTLVRHPYDIALSKMRFDGRQFKSRRHAGGRLRWLLLAIDRLVYRFPVAFVIKQIVRYVLGDRGNSLYRFRDYLGNRDNLDLVMRLEELDRDLAKLKTRISCPNRKVPHANSSHSFHRREKASMIFCVILDFWYREDIKNFYGGKTPEESRRPRLPLP